MNRNKEVLLLIFLIILFLGINYRFIDSNVIGFLEESDSAVVGRVIDGDTIVTKDNLHVRLLGINTPERKEFYYQEAKEFLSNLILNKTVKLEYGTEKYDKYNRTLAYIFLNKTNINAELIRNGFANPYIYDNDKYTNEIRNAWNECIQRQENLCRRTDSKCAQCIELKELDVEKQEIILYNHCNFDCNLNNWTIKDEGRKKFAFSGFILKENKEVKVIVGNKTGTEDVLFWDEDYVWTSGGDTLFLRDEKGNLVLWTNY